LEGDGCNLSSGTRSLQTALREPALDLADAKAKPSAELEGWDRAGLGPVDDRAGGKAELVGELAGGQEAIAQK
jgi:hypothetical protein